MSCAGSAPLEARLIGTCRFRMVLRSSWGVLWGPGSGVCGVQGQDPVGSRVGVLWGAGSGSCGVQGRGPVGFRVGVHGGFVVALRLGGLIFESQRF